MDVWNCSTTWIQQCEMAIEKDSLPLAYVNISCIQRREIRAALFTSLTISQVYLIIYLQNAGVAKRLKE